jgi:hypothetical protein
LRRFFPGSASAKLLPTRFELLTSKFLSKSTTFGIRDTAFLGKAKKSWVIRVDNPHVNADFHHLNINSKMTGVKDPHIQLPSGAAKLGGVATKTLNVVGKAAIIAAVVVDTVRLAKYFF